MTRVESDALDPKKAQVFGEMVEAYIKTGKPIASKTLADRFEVSDATIRNWFADMELLGLLKHQHVSSGRLPTDAGYRFFVDHLVDTAKFGPRELAAIENYLPRHHSPDDLAEGASRLLTRMTSSASLVVTPEPDNVEIRSVIFQGMSSTRVLVIAVLANSEVINTVIESADPISEAEADAASTLARTVFAGQTISQLPRKISVPKDFSIADLERIQALVDQGTQALREYLTTHTRARIHVSGSHKLAEKLPGAETQPILALLETAADVVANRAERAARDSERVTIGSENEIPELRRFSIVLSPVLGSDGAVNGLTLVLDETRTDYGLSMRATEAVSDRLSATFGR